MSTGVLSDAYRRKWLTAGTIVVDTFDGAFDTLDRYELTAYTLSNCDVWLIDECGFLSPHQWRHLTFISSQCPHVVQLLAGDRGQFKPREDDGGEAAGANVEACCDTARYICASGRLRRDNTSAQCRKLILLLCADKGVLLPR